MNDFPPAHSALLQDGWLCLFVWCRACFHQAPADPRKDKAMIEQLSDAERRTIVASLTSVVQRTYGDQARARVNSVLAKISGTDKRVFVTDGEPPPHGRQT